MPTENYKFPADFVWGAATSSYQIEGAVSEDGKGEDIWDVFTKEDYRIFEHHTGETACDHYHRFKEDVKLMKEIGLHAYRFSINWSRVLPNGYGQVNEKGIAFYNALINELLANDIEPYITLYHWELPYELYKRGGWLNPQIVDWFGDYARLIAERFSDRVKNFFTLNEPQCFVGLGFLTGEHAPGVQAPLRDTFEMAHNALKAHGKAVQMLRAYGKQKLTIGYEKYLPKITDDDMKLISEPIDIYGQNIYNGQCIRMGKDGHPEYVRRYEGFPKTAIDWPVTPECLNWGPRFLYERYKTPIYITENGMSCHDVVSLDGKVHDPNRIDFLARYLDELKKAATVADIRGYFQWSLMDNFEWSKGYSERFGLIYIDYQTQQRILKDSAYWYKDYIKNNGEF